jgi:hypothetical protein
MDHDPESLGKLLVDAESANAEAWCRSGIALDEFTLSRALGTGFTLWFV